MVESHIYEFLVIAVIAFGVLRWFDRRSGWSSCALQLKQLQLELEVQRKRYEQQIAEYEHRINELEERVDFLVSELQRSGVHIHDLERALIGGKSLPKFDTPLLLIGGMDDAIFNSDRQALRRAGVSFKRLPKATKKTIADELRRRRQDGRLPPWLHIAAHAAAAGILLEDGVADPSWWHENMDGVQVIMLAACQTVAVADALAGLCTVVFVHEDIENRDASDFTYAFWRHMVEHGDPVQAYRQAVNETPQIAEFTDIRR